MTDRNEQKMKIKVALAAISNPGLAQAAL